MSAFVLTMGTAPKTHPAAALFPLLPEAEIEMLAADIREFGQHQPIVLFEGQILDGRNRYEACRRAGVKPRFTEYLGSDPIGFVISMNLKRRHLDESQRAMVAGRIAVLRKGANQHTAIAVPTQQHAAELLNVSVDAIQRARTVLDTGVPELVAAVDTGQVAVSTAAVIATAPAVEQQQIVARGEKEIVAKAKAIRERKNGERREQRIVMLAEAARAECPLELPARAAIVLADPPWRYEHPFSESRKIENHYPTMPLADICALPVSTIITADCLLYLWTTNPLLVDALKVIEAWGFRYVTNHVWVKDKVGMGKRVRQRHELLLIAMRGSFPAPDPAEMADSVIEAPRTEHSAKPPVVYELIERQYPTLPKAERFARNTRAGWMAWGNQLPSDGNAVAP